MKKFLLRLGIVVAVLVGGWLLAFGAKGPCDAFRAEAARVSEGENADYRKAVKAGVLDRPDLGTWTCFSGAIQLKIRGRDAITVLTSDGKRK